METNNQNIFAFRIKSFLTQLSSEREFADVGTVTEMLDSVKAISKMNIRSVEHLKEVLYFIWVRNDEQQNQFNSTFERFFTITKPKEEAPKEENERAERAKPTDKSKEEPKPEPAKPKDDILPEKADFMSSIGSLLDFDYEPAETEIIKQYIAKYLKPTAVLLKKKSRINIRATVQNNAEVGWPSRIVYKGLKHVMHYGVLAIDKSESMYPFYHITRKLNELKVDKYQFNNVPQVDFYKKHPFEHINRILIWSDAGAARKTYQTKRIEKTKHFLNKAKDVKIVWLNPMPKIRWYGSAADTISYHCTMIQSDALALEKQFIKKHGKPISITRI